MTTRIHTSPTSWTKVADSVDSVLITFKDNGILQINIGTADPDSMADFHTITPRNPYFSASGLSAKKVYVRSGTEHRLVVSVDTV